MAGLKASEGTEALDTGAGGTADPAAVPAVLPARELQVRVIVTVSDGPDALLITSPAGTLSAFATVMALRRDADHHDSFSVLGANEVLTEC